ncbi:adenylate/guanylate cyclase domain-containing protein [Leptothermofonsia sp. ETS-13]|uniref:adenylate/guanylate cyclase domain-containing protein n=1 Tax=Leptothermofonsia sp. ETS-13 TaxID=3035696 RepID=UPI003BA23123
MGTEQEHQPLQGHRTLAAIVFSDVVNYSGRMSHNEEHTLKLVQRDLELMTRFCEQYEGRVLKFTGDGLLMYFTSAVQAVACALEVQKTIAAIAANLPESDRLQHRIGIHLGDVFVSPTDVMGDGVNIAARLQSEAEPGGICLSQIVYDVVKKRLALQATYLGPRELKHIQESIPIYQIVLAAQSKTTNLKSELERTLTESAGVEVDDSIKQDLNPLSMDLPLLADDVKKALERLLVEAVGPIASVLFQQTLNQTDSRQDLIERLVAQLPDHLRNSFRSRADDLLKELGENPPPRSPPPPAIKEEAQPAASRGAIDLAFVKRCELELTKAIGPIAPLIIQRTLSQQPGLSRHQLVEALSSHLPNPRMSESFRRDLLTPS